MIVIMKSRILLFLGLLSCIGLQMFAQVSVSGKVVDAGGIEMPGVNIAIKGTMVGTMVRLLYQVFQVEKMPYWFFRLSVLGPKR